MNTATKETKQTLSLSKGNNTRLPSKESFDEYHRKNGWDSKSRTGLLAHFPPHVLARLLCFFVHGYLPEAIPENSNHSAVAKYENTKKGLAKELKVELNINDYVNDFTSVRQVNKCWHSMCESNSIWKQHCIVRWPNMNPRIFPHPGNWRLYFLRKTSALYNAAMKRTRWKKSNILSISGRSSLPTPKWVTVISSKEPYNLRRDLLPLKDAARIAAYKESRSEPHGLSVAIENCALGMKNLSERKYKGELEGRVNDKFQRNKLKLEWEFECPVIASLLQETNDPTIDYCTKCKENVYLVTSKKELNDHVNKGHCVAFDAKIESQLILDKSGGSGHLIEVNKLRLDAKKEQTNRPLMRKRGKVRRPPSFQNSDGRSMPSVQIFYSTIGTL
jgi:hypothetical protein